MNVRPAFFIRSFALAEPSENKLQMRIRLLGEDHPKHIRPLNDTKSVLAALPCPLPFPLNHLLSRRAIDAGANFISETFLFVFVTAISAYE